MMEWWAAYLEAAQQEQGVGSWLNRDLRTVCFAPVYRASQSSAAHVV